MKRGTKIALFGAAATALAAGTVSVALTDLFVREALDRKEPEIMARSKGRISGSKREQEAIQTAQYCAERLRARMDEMERFEIESYDGTPLVGYWYPCEHPKRVLVAMHGWRSSWAGDFGTSVDFWRENGCSILFPEQRGQGESGGDNISFGLMERFDCLEWARWAAQNTPADLPIYLAGLSMGATTVLMTAGLELPERVRGIIADCGFTSPRAIWKHVMEDNLHLSYRLRARQVEFLCRRRIRCASDSFSTVDAMKQCKVPVLFIHGTGDTFVPVEMTYENYQACAAEKQLLIVPGAGHGMSYPTAPELYKQTVVAFWEKYDG